MFEHFVTGRTLPEAYHQALLALHREHTELPCPDYNTNQKEASMTMVVTEPLAEPMISMLFIGDPRSLEQYRQEMLDGILDFEVARGNWEYTYHQRMENQIPWVIDELRRNPDSRRAVVFIRSEEDMHTGSPACLQHIQYFIREDKLHCKILFRSNDATKAAYMNAFALIMLQKRIADELGVGMGTYTHRANSFHCYERDYNMLEGYVRRIESGSDITFNYVGDWDEQMEEAKLDIAEMVRKQKEKG
jgi:thymidylate synthase